MDEPKSASEVFKEFVIRGEPNACSETENPAQLDHADYEANFKKINGMGNECLLPTDLKPERLDDNPKMASTPKPLTNNNELLDIVLAIEDQSGTQAIQATVEHLAQDVKTIAKSSEKTADEVRELHKLYHNEFANRLKSMQDELERYREMEKGRVFDGILSEVAMLYSDNESVIEEITNDKTKKQIRYMFMDILQILEANGVSKLRSNPGDKRNTRHCQIIERIPNCDPTLHDTVVQSRSTGFYVENRSLVKEFVDIYIFADTIADNSADN